MGKKLELEPTALQFEPVAVGLDDETRSKLGIFSYAFASTSGRVVAVLTRNDSHVIGVLDPGQSEPRTVPVDMRVEWRVAASPDGTRVLLPTDQKLYELDVDSGSTRELWAKEDALALTACY